MLILKLNLPIVIVGLFLFALSAIDIYTYKSKKGYIPSAFSTLAIIVALVLVGAKGLYGGILVLLIGLLFVDLSMFDGIADLKVLIAAGIVLSTLINVIIFAVIVSFLSLIYKFFIKKYTKKKTIAFIPVILISYLITVLGTNMLYVN